MLPGDDDLNYGTTIVSCALASFLMLTAALPSDWQAPPANTREARAVKVAALLKQNKKLAKKDGRVVEFRASCPRQTRPRPSRFPRWALFVVAPAAGAGAKPETDLRLLEDRGHPPDSRDGWAQISAEASRSLKGRRRAQRAAAVPRPCCGAVGDGRGTAPSGVSPQPN